jgi:hypothetical protein
MLIMTAGYKAADEIRRLLRTVPPRFNQWFHGDVLAFKEVVRQARLVVEAKKPNAAKVQQCLRDLQRMYQP